MTFGAAERLLRPLRSVRRPGSPLKLAFVTPWYGPDIPGGMESQTRRTLARLLAEGVEVEVLTTCIRDFFSHWANNARPPGLEQVDGIPVRRFPVKTIDSGAYELAQRRLFSGDEVRPSEIKVLEQEQIRCPSLIRYVATHRAEYDLFVFIPYLFPTSYLAARACPGQAVHIPCLHDEPYARLPHIEAMFREARGFLFNSDAELRLAKRLYSVPDEKCALAGEGVEIGWTGDGQRFREKRGLSEYLLYVGRKEEGKNFPLLLDLFARYRRARAPNLSLVVIGPGQTFESRDGLLDLGFVSEQEKHDALAGAVALVQPSLLESFSLTVMESWLARRPVLVHEGCEVTRDHCLNSDGGLWFSGYQGFAACLDRLRADPALGAALGNAGEAYVLGNYSWPKVMEKYLAALGRFR